MPSPTDLTPELASLLLAKPHPKQRRPARQTVNLYADEMRRGRWRDYVPDPIMVDPDGRLFNGAHRAAAVLTSGVTIRVLIEYGADPALYDVIDVGRKRSAYQFVAEPEATTRASAARVMLWYRHRFDGPLVPRTVGYFDLAEIIAETERASETMAAAMPFARAIYEWTGISQSVGLAVFVLASDGGFDWDQLAAFRDGVVDPSGLAADDPRRVFADKTRRQRWRDRRRPLMDDWTILVRALNAHLNGERLDRIDLSRFWPSIGETSGEYNRRRKSLGSQDHRDSVAAGVVAATRKRAG